MIVRTIRPARIAALIRMINVAAKKEMMNEKGSACKKEAIRTKIPNNRKKQEHRIRTIRMSHQMSSLDPGESAILDLVGSAVTGYSEPAPGAPFGDGVS